MPDLVRPIDKSLAELVREQHIEIFKKIVLWEEAVTRRMLHFWQQEWGKPILVRLAGKPEPYPQSWRESCTITFRSDLWGLGCSYENLPAPAIRIYASDHVGENGEPLTPPEPQMSLEALVEMLK